MPIRTENRARYPKNWKAISLSVRADAGNKCEWCGAPNHTVGYRDLDGNYVEQYMADAMNSDVGYSTFGEYSPTLIKIVLTVAHLDHTPENCERSNLKALCQRCHNRYDAPMRAAGRKARRRESQQEIPLSGKE